MGAATRPMDAAIIIRHGMCLLIVNRSAVTAYFVVPLDV